MFRKALSLLNQTCKSHALSAILTPGASISRSHANLFSTILTHHTTTQTMQCVTLVWLQRVIYVGCGLGEARVY